MNKYKDTDLREALHRKYANEPQLPADFMAKMEQRTNVPNGNAAGNKRRPLWRWVAAAACFLLIIGVSMTLVPTDQPPQSEPQIAQKVELQSKAEQPSDSNMPSYDEQQAELLIEKSRVADSGKQTVSELMPIKEQKVTEKHDDPITVQVANLHYAALIETDDTVKYQAPSRVDDFIAKMAEYNKVKESELTCSTPLDSNVVSRVYVFPDKQEIDVFGRLLQVACSYSDATPGYHLYFSHLQFFFELQDVRKHLQYRWIAERVNGKILLYSTNAPLGVNTSSACYQEYRDELMNTKIINTKTKEI